MGDVMKTKFVRTVLVFMCFSLFLGIGGCGKKTDNSVSTQDSDNFAKFTQEERIHFVEEYLKTQYGLETAISDVKKRQINSFSSEEMYYAIAKCEDDSRIFCWVDENGKISDSKFINDLQNPINSLFAEKVSKKLNNYQVICNCTLNSPTDKIWSKNQLEQMLSSEDISISVRIFVEHDEKKVVEDLVNEAFDDAFSFATGNCYIYFVESAETITVSDIDLTNYDLHFEFKKD